MRGVTEATVAGCSLAVLVATGPANAEPPQRAVQNDESAARPQEPASREQSGDSLGAFRLPTPTWMRLVLWLEMPDWASVTPVVLRGGDEWEVTRVLDLSDVVPGLRLESYFGEQLSIPSGPALCVMDGSCDGRVRVQGVRLAPTDGLHLGWEQRMGGSAGAGFGLFTAGSTW